MADLDTHRVCVQAGALVCAALLAQSLPSEVLDSFFELRCSG